MNDVRRWRIYGALWICAARRCVGASGSENREDYDCGGYDEGFVGLYEN